MTVNGQRVSSGDDENVLELCSGDVNTLKTTKLYTLEEEVL